MTSPVRELKAAVPSRNDRVPSLPERREERSISPMDDNIRKETTQSNPRKTPVMLEEQQQRYKISLDSVSTCSSKESSSTATSSVVMEIFLRQYKKLFHNSEQEETKEFDDDFADDILSDSERELEQETERTLLFSGMPRRLPPPLQPNITAGSNLRGRSVYSSSGDSSQSPHPSRDDQTLPSLVSYHLSNSNGDSFSTSCDTGSIVSSCTSSLVQSLRDNSDVQDSDGELSKDECDERAIVRSRSLPFDTPKYIDCRRRKVTQRRIQRRANREAQRAARDARVNGDELPESAKGTTAATIEESPPKSPPARLRPILNRTEQENSYTVRVDNRTRILRESQAQRSTSNRSRSSTNGSTSNHYRRSITSSSRWDPM
jgi:hypothetical protein